MSQKTNTGEGEMQGWECTTQSGGKRVFSYMGLCPHGVKNYQRCQNVLLEGGTKGPVTAKVPKK